MHAIAFLLSLSFLACGKSVACGGPVAQAESPGTITTIAGTGKPGSNGAAGMALETNIDQPFGVEIGPDGALYITEVGWSASCSPAWI